MRFDFFMHRAPVVRLRRRLSSYLESFEQTSARWRKTYGIPSVVPEQAAPPLVVPPPEERGAPPLLDSLAEYLATRSEAKHIIRLGRWPAQEPRHAPGLFDFDFIYGDLGQGLPALDDELWRDAVVCADGIEHLADPGPLLAGLGHLATRCKYLLLSTPDRDWVQGVGDGRPATHSEGALPGPKWNARELVHRCAESGFPLPLSVGHTFDSDHGRTKSTLLVLSGRHALPIVPANPVRVAAIIAVYNEADILAEVTNHLHRQGVAVHLVDNWSSDGSFELAQALVAAGVAASARRYPEEPRPDYEWFSLLRHTEQLARTLDADWILHHDADEIRCSPWPGLSLRDAIGAVDRLGYNAIDFTVLDFRFLRGVPAAPNAGAGFEQRLNHFEFGRRPGHFVQIKGWKQTREAVELADSGGHEARFAQRRVFPLKFLLKHYPLRSHEQAQRKVFVDRLPRMKRENRERGWHTQYNPMATRGRVDGWDRYVLIPFSEPMFRSEFLVERLSGLGIDPELR